MVIWSVASFRPGYTCYTCVFSFVGEITFYNIFYEVFTVCTSIVAQDPSGKINTTLPHVRQAKFCLRVCQVVFLGVLPFSPHLLIGPSHMSCNNLERDVKLNKKFLLHCTYGTSNVTLTWDYQKLRGLFL